MLRLALIFKALSPCGCCFLLEYRGCTIDHWHIQLAGLVGSRHWQPQSCNRHRMRGLGWIKGYLSFRPHFATAHLVFFFFMTDFWRLVVGTGLSLPGALLQGFPFALYDSAEQIFSVEWDWSTRRCQRFIASTRVLRRAYFIFSDLSNCVWMLVSCPWQTLPCCPLAITHGAPESLVIVLDLLVTAVYDPIYPGFAKRCKCQIAGHSSPRSFCKSLGRVVYIRHTVTVPRLMIYIPEVGVVLGIEGRESIIVIMRGKEKACGI
ncbi:hypothetical protein BJ165DRAFT_279603 [Panaeolus papilionaceus]|nr:hypothetical protein BJ165DRAFT_279603 [Panaeolus papilionaceus]